MSTKNIPEKYLDELKHLILNYFQGKNVKVYLFGSRAKGSERRRSDVDIAILPLQELPVGSLGVLAEKIEQSHIPYTVTTLIWMTQANLLEKKFWKKAFYGKIKSKTQAGSRCFNFS